MNKAMQLKARMKNRALKSRVSAQSVLQNFMLERLLERISLSPHMDKFILKGGMLIASPVGLENRATMDMDSTLAGYPLSEESLRSALSDICEICLEDETTFSLNSIRSGDEYGGFRAVITAQYVSIKTPLKFDITTGDVITPCAIRYEFPSQFEDKIISIWAYNIETILAEKVETILSRGVLNTRLRDFYDVYAISKTQKIDKNLFLTALHATSQKRETLQSLRDKKAILDSIKTDTVMGQRWNLYKKDNHYAHDILFDDLVQALKNLLM